MKDEMLTLTAEWDKTFPKSDKVDHKKITFHNRYGITLAADMYTPKNASGNLPATLPCRRFRNGMNWMWNCISVRIKTCSTPSSIIRMPSNPMPH